MFAELRTVGILLSILVFAVAFSVCGEAAACDHGCADACCTAESVPGQSHTVVMAHVHGVLAHSSGAMLSVGAAPVAPSAVLEAGATFSGGPLVPLRI